MFVLDKKCGYANHAKPVDTVCFCGTSLNLGINPGSYFLPLANFIYATPPVASNRTYSWPGGLPGHYPRHGRVCFVISFQHLYLPATTGGRYPRRYNRLLTYFYE